VEVEIREAIEFHLEGMREDGVPIPTPQSKVDYVEVSAQQAVSPAPGLAPFGRSVRRR